MKSDVPEFAAQCLTCQNVKTKH